MTLSIMTKDIMLSVIYAKFSAFYVMLTVAILIVAAPIK
jgi:hypothetical protein